MQRSSMDCLTAYFRAFTGDKVPDINSTPMYSYTPIGPCIELGILENVFGDANFCIKREVFEALNGFTEDRTTSWEDWEFLAKLNLMGYKQDVIPEYIFWYRCLEQGFSRITNHYANHIRVLKSYYTHGSSLQQQIRLIDTITVPLYYAYLNKNSSLNLNRLGYKITGKLYSVIDRVPTIRKALRFTFQIIVMPLWKFYKQLCNYFKKLM
jgi:GT2 family glycosyltransferase